eukprot:11139068-Alexandrium_andersonii.AAC.2
MAPIASVQRSMASRMSSSVSADMAEDLKGKKDPPLDDPAEPDRSDTLQLSDDGLCQLVRLRPSNDSLLDLLRRPVLDDIAEGHVRRHDRRPLFKEGRLESLRMRALKPWLKIRRQEPEQHVPIVIRHPVRGRVPSVHDGMVRVIEGQSRQTHVGLELRCHPSPVSHVLPPPNDATGRNVSQANDVSGAVHSKFVRVEKLRAPMQPVYAFEMPHE